MHIQSHMAIVLILSLRFESKFKQFWKDPNVPTYLYKERYAVKNQKQNGFYDYSIIL